MRIDLPQCNFKYCRYSLDCNCTASDVKREQCEFRLLVEQNEYINSLENLLIFMCQTYTENEKALLLLAKQGNEAFFNVPRIQGTVNTISIARIAEVEFQKPKHGFNDVKKEILQKRGLP